MQNTANRAGNVSGQTECEASHPPTNQQTKHTHQKQHITQNKNITSTIDRGARTNQILATRGWIYNARPCRQTRLGNCIYLRLGLGTTLPCVREKLALALLKMSVSLKGLRVTEERYHIRLIGRSNRSVRPEIHLILVFNIFDNCKRDRSYLYSTILRGARTCRQTRLGLLGTTIRWLLAG